MKQSNLTKVFKALSNDQRLKIFEVIYRENQKVFVEEEGCICYKGVKKVFSIICDKHNISKSTVSHHIKELQNSGLIECERDGQSYVCKVNQQLIAKIRNFLN